MIGAYATISGIADVDYYVDDGYSAKNLRRPAIQKLIAACREKNYTFVIIWRLDRLFRSLRDTVNVVEDVFRVNGVEIISVTERIDTSTTSGCLMMNILASIAQNEREVTAERVGMVMNDLATQCLHLGGVPPYGYGVDKDKRYFIKPEEAVVVRGIYGLYAKNQSYGDILLWMDENGFKTRTGKPFSKATIHDMLLNEKYNGVYVYNRSAPADSTGKRNHRSSKDNDKIIRIPGGMPRIVDMETWKAVQIAMKRNLRQGGRNKALHTYILSGLVECGKCGKQMAIHYSGKDRDGTPQRRYDCGNKCGTRIRYEKLDEYVLQYIESLTENEELVRQAVQIANDSARNEQREKHADLPGLKEELSQVNTEIENIMACVRKLGVAAAPMAASLDALHEKRTSIESEIDQCAQNVHLIAEDDLIRELRELKEIRNLPAQRQKELIANIVQRVIVHEDHVVIHLDSSGNGGGEGDRTPVRRPELKSFSERSLCFNVPSARPPKTRFRFQ